MSDPLPARCGRCVRLFTGHTAPVHALSFSPCGSYLATAGDDRAVIGWDIGSGRLCRILKGHTRPIWSLAFSRCGRMLASGAADGTVKLWSGLMAPPAQVPHTAAMHLQLPCTHSCHALACPILHLALLWPGSAFSPQLASFLLAPRPGSS